MDFDIRWVDNDEDRAAVYRLRYEIYVEGQGLHKDEADHERRWLADEADDVAHIALAEVEGKVVGTVRVTLLRDKEPSARDVDVYGLERFEGVVEREDIAFLTRLMVYDEYRGGGVLPFQLLWAALEELAARNVELLLAHCEPHLVNRYRTLGFRAYGEMVNHPTTGALVRIACVLGDVAHLRRIGSPLAGALVRRTRPSDRVDDVVALLNEDRAVKSRGHDDTDEYWAELLHWLADGNEGLHGILDELSTDEASALLAKSHILHCRPGDAIIVKGNVSTTLYMLLEGTLDVVDDGRVVAKVETPGDLVGEVAFFTQGQRMSDVVSGAGGAKVLALSASNLKKIINGYGPAAAKLLDFVARGLCRKLLERAG